MSGKRWARRSEVRRGGERAGLDGAPGGNGEAALLCCEGARNGMVALEGSRRALRLQVENTSSGFRPATARGLGGQSAVDARRTRGHRVLNRPSTVAPEFFVSVTNEPTDSETCRQ